MARGFGAAWRPLDTTKPPPKRLIKADIICLHTMVGYLTSTDRMFRANGWSGTESHFGVGGKWGSDAGQNLDGAVWQWVDTAYQADANLDGNYHIISIETADNAASRARDIEPWTPKQVEAIAQLIARLAKEHDIPLQLIPDSKPGRRGIGYHRQGCTHSSGVGKVSGFRVSGGEVWSTAVGKECPTPARIAQIPAVIERARQITKGWSTPATTTGNQEVGMADMTRAELSALLDQRIEAALSKNRTGEGERDPQLDTATLVEVGVVAARRAFDTLSAVEAVTPLLADLQQRLERLEALLQGPKDATPQQPGQ